MHGGEDRLRDNHVPVDRDITRTVAQIAIPETHGVI